MTTPTRGLLFHFTHADNLESIVRHGIECDAAVQAGRLTTEIGNHEIKLRRRARVVPIAPGGVVADYVPFYFAARSPMLYVITKGQVPTYQAGQEDIVYLVTSVETVERIGLPFVFTDRNAALDYARLDSETRRLDDLIDWDLMEARMWKDDPGHPDRKERRMAELLVHRRVPWDAVLRVGAFDAARRSRAEAILTRLDQRTPVRIEGDWYY